jgi:ferrochelatase
MRTIGLLLMAYGSPESLEEIGSYLLDIRGGRPTSKELVEEIKDRYAQIGGKSPLLEITQRQANALEKELNQRYASQGLIFNAYVGMRHWEPRIKEAVARMAEDGITQAVALVMAPHDSQMSTGAYYDKLKSAVEELEAGIHFVQLCEWYNHPGLIEAITEKAREALKKFDGVSPFVVFTAHSLPSRILDQGDSYDRQLKETTRLLAEKLGLEEGRWQFSYQSAGRSQEPWLGPRIEDVIVSLAISGEENILVVPVGFVCDHVEVLYDIDIAGRKLAEEHGAHLERSESLNDSPAFIQALADLVSSRLADFEREGIS